MGLGWWTYVTLLGKGSKKITFITTYNAYPSTGDRTYYHQQLRLLSRMNREQLIDTAPNPRRQFILDLQAWIKSIQNEGHTIVLAMDAHVVFNPDSDPSPSHNLTFDPKKLTKNSRHYGKLATLVSTCHLSLPLATHHADRPFPASHI
jgi:hypothetical protein